MKKILFIFAILVFFVSCENADKRNLRNTNKNNFNNYKIIVIDGCEYIQYASAYDYQHITHKGNCKFCAERQKK